MKGIQGGTTASSPKGRVVWEIAFYVVRVATGEVEVLKYVGRLDVN